MALVEPMLAVASTGASGRPKFVLADLLATGEWAVDTKLDGVRAWWIMHRLISREGEDLTMKFPEVAQQMERQAGDLVVDGEIVAVNGRFETTLSRSSQQRAHTAAAMARDFPARFVAFDLPMLGKPSYNDTAWLWLERRERLDALAEGAGWPVTPWSMDISLFAATREQQMEGVIAKRITSRYMFGKRSPQWVKFKHLHRISCLIAGYEPGQGSREHFGAMHLALLNPDGTPEIVGKCGSGFTVKETHELKRRIDSRSEVLVAEIETTHLTSGGTLRFPVFRGLRTDVLATACTTDQLDTLPRS